MSISFLVYYQHTYFVSIFFSQRCRTIICFAVVSYTHYSNISAFLIRNAAYCSIFMLVHNALLKYYENVEMRNAAIYLNTHITSFLRIRIPFCFFLTPFLCTSILHLKSIYTEGAYYITQWRKIDNVKIAFVVIRAFTSPIKILFRRFVNPLALVEQGKPTGSIFNDSLQGSLRRQNAFSLLFHYCEKFPWRNDVRIWQKLISEKIAHSCLILL